MLIVLAIVVFITVALAIFSFGAAAATPGSVLGARLRAMSGQPQVEENKPALRERLEQALDPISKAIPLSTADVSRTRAWLIQAGFRDASHVSYYFGHAYCWPGWGWRASCYSLASIVFSCWSAFLAWDSLYRASC